MASNSALITYGNLSTFKDNLDTYNAGKYMDKQTYTDTSTTIIKSAVLPLATTSDTGVVKIGAGINIAADGAISLAVGDGITIENNTIKPVVATTADINALFTT